MKKITKIWNELADDESVTDGLLMRRYSSSLWPDFFAGFQKPDGLKCIVIKLNTSHNVNLSRYQHFKDIKLELREDKTDSAKQLLVIFLVNSQHADVFATLCEDLILGTANLSDEAIVLKDVLNRIEKWKSLLDTIDAEGLDKEKQRGLYGELHFLRSWLSNSGSIYDCIQAWTGPEMAIRDFQFQAWALEVKTTQGNNHQKIQISSERQLDTTNVEHLFLLHLSLEVQQHNGETLNELVEDILALLSIDLAAQFQFQSKLFLAGYMDRHKETYKTIGYQVRAENFYLVASDFPRLEEKDIPAGVGDIKYSIILSEYTDYIISETKVCEILNSNGK